MFLSITVKEVGSLQLSLSLKEVSLLWPVYYSEGGVAYAPAIPTKEGMAYVLVSPSEGGVSSVPAVPNIGGVASSVVCFFA